MTEEPRAWVNWNECRKAACEPWFFGVPAALTDQQMDAVEAELGATLESGKKGAWITKREWVDACRRAKAAHPGVGKIIHKKDCAA